VTALPLALTLLLGAPGGGDAQSRLAQANAAYRGGDFSAAAAGYEALLAEGWESPGLHLNLGNARFRLGQRGRAAASFERALRLDPGDTDARANLALARANNVDRVLGEAPAPLLARLAERTPALGAAAALVAGWLALWIALAARRRAPRRVREVSTATALAGAAIALAAGLLLAGRAAAARTPAAVVIAPSSAVRDGPEPALRAVFELHEGTRLQVLERRGGAARVRLGNGLEGWVAAGDLEVI
jgi:tetratricopeptide (TPR) repeat protein